MVPKEGGYEQTNKTSMRTQTNAYVFGVPTEVTNPDGSKQLATATLMEDGARIRLQTKTPNGLDVVTIYEMQADGSLLATITLDAPKGQIVVRRIFEKKA